MARVLKVAEDIAPCVLFIDEIDRFGRRGQPGEHETTRRTFSILLERTDGFSGAELEELVIRAARYAFRRSEDKVTWDDFEEAIATFRIDAGARDRQRQEYIQLAERYCNDLSLLERTRRKQLRRY